MRKAFWLTLVVLQLDCASHRNEEVAIVNGTAITVEQFTARYKKYLAATNSRDNILLRQQILNNMANEVLIYADLSKRGLDNGEEYTRTMEDIANQELLNAYARHVVTDTATIPESRLHEEFRAYNTKFTARYLYARSLQGARELRARIMRGETFEQLAKEVFEDPGLANNGGSLGTFGWGDMESALEGTVIGMNAGEVSDPVRLSMGYAIIKLDHRVENRMVTEADYLKVREKLWRAVLQRHAESIGRQQIEQIERQLAPRFEEETVRQVFAHWRDVRQGPPIPVELVRSMPDISGRVLMKFSTGEWTVGDFLKRVEKTSERQRKRVRTDDDVKSMAIGLAAREVVLDRARKLGLATEAHTIESIQQKREAFLLKRWLAVAADSAGRTVWPEDTLRKKFNESRAERAFPPEVNVAEILVRTQREADSLARLVASGKDFAELARKNSIRTWAAKRGGELGFGTEARFGIMGRKFFEGRIGSIVGPEHVDPYFAIFKILERRSGRPKSFEEARPDIEAELTQMKKLESQQQAVALLRGGAQVSINNTVLEHIVVH